MMTEKPGEACPVTDESPRCWRCGRKLVEYASRPWKVMCGKCKAPNASAPAHWEVER